MEKKRKLTIAKAMAEAVALEMRSGSDVLVMGEDIAKMGGVFGNTQGLLDEFGADRVRDTPISETGFIGAAVGMAAAGMRPVVELMFVDFFGVCMDAIYNLAAKQSYFSGGNVTCPMVLMTSVGGGYGDAGQHSQTLYATFGHLPGLKVVIPSTAYDAKGMMASAIADPNPVIFMYHKALQGMGWLGTVQRSITHVPEEHYVVPLDKAAIVREGQDLTITGLGHTVHLALDAAESLAAQGISAEVIDLRTIRPLDTETIVNSVKKTSRLITCEEGFPFAGVGSEIAMQVMEQAFDWLDAPVARVTGKDVPMPYAANLETLALPQVDDIVATALATCEGFRGA